MRIKCLLLAVLMLLCSCTQTQTPIPDESDGEKLKNGELIIIETQSAISLPLYDFDTFNPIVTTSDAVADGMMAVYEPLFTFDELGHSKGCLAEGITMSSDGVRAVVKLKSGVKWHDGTPFTAEDVVYTVNTIKNNNSPYSTNMRDVVSCRAEGSEVIFNLSRPVPEFTSLLNFPIIKNKTPSNADYIPVGTGPYKYEKKADSNKITFCINDEWHGGAAAIKNVSFEMLKDKESAVYAFEANELQCITTRTIDLTKHTPKGAVKSAEYVSNNMIFLGMNFYNSVLWGESTRQALAAVVDKEKIVKSDLYGRAVEADVPVNPSLWYADNETGYDYSVAGSEELLAADGWIRNEYGKFIRDFNGTNQSLALELIVNGESDEKMSIANRIASQMNDMGMVINVVPLSYADYAQRINSRQFDLFIGEVEMPVNMDPTFLVGSGGNYFTYVSGQMDNLIKTLGLTYDPTAYIIIQQQFAQLFCKDMPFVPICFRKGGLIYSSSIKGGVRPNAFGIYNTIGNWFVQPMQQK